MGFFDMIGQKISEGAKWIGQKVSDGANWVGEKVMPIVGTIAKGVQGAMPFLKPIAGLLPYGDKIADLVGKGADWVVNNTGKINNALETTKKVAGELQNNGVDGIGRSLKNHIRKGL